MSDTTNWIDRFRASVSWGDDIHTALLPSGTPYCWVEVEGQRRCWVPGSLGDLHTTIALAQQVLATADCSGAIALFLDEAATAYQVEEACHVLGQQDVGCSFLEPQPQVLHHDLLCRASEGTLLEKAAPAAPIHTAAELDRMAKDYLNRTLGGGLGPGPMSDAELGAGFRERLGDQDTPDEVSRIGAVLASWETNDANLGQHIHQIAACGLFEQQLQQYQQDHQVSGLLEKPFEFPPLGFATTELRLGMWLEPIGDDLSRLRQAAQELGQEFKSLADGVGHGWLQYRQMNFTTEDGTPAWRYIRDDWATLNAVLQQAGSAYLSAGIELGQSQEAALELTAWVGGSWGGEGDGDAHSFLLVHPSLADELDHPDCWWC